MKNNIKTAIVGYGASHCMGRSHVKRIIKTKGIIPVAICDLDKNQIAEAKIDFPQIRAYQSIDQLISEDIADLYVIVTPNHTHARLGIKCIQAKKNVILEKPMCLTTDEADSLISAAKKKNVMLSVYHIRRFDGNYLAIKQLIKKKLLATYFTLS